MSFRNWSIAFSSEHLDELFLLMHLRFIHLHALWVTLLTLFSPILWLLITACTLAFMIEVGSIPRLSGKVVLDWEELVDVLDVRDRTKSNFKRLLCVFIIIEDTWFRVYFVQLFRILSGGLAIWIIGIRVWWSLMRRFSMDIRVLIYCIFVLSVFWTQKLSLEAMWNEISLNFDRFNDWTFTLFRNKSL